MPQVSEQEFAALPLRVHAFPAGVPLHDVWAGSPRSARFITVASRRRALRARLQHPDRPRR